MLPGLTGLIARGHWAVLELRFPVAGFGVAVPRDRSSPEYSSQNPRKATLLDQIVAKRFQRSAWDQAVVLTVLSRSPPSGLPSGERGQHLDDSAIFQRDRLGRSASRGHGVDQERRSCQDIAQVAAG